MKPSEVHALYPHLPYAVVKMRLRRGIPLDTPYAQRPTKGKPRPPRRAVIVRPDPLGQIFNEWVGTSDVGSALSNEVRLLVKP